MLKSELRNIPPDQKQEGSDLPKWFGLLVYSFFPMVGLIYACGFVIVFSFFKSYGINNVDFVQAKFIHVGSVFAMACLVIILPMSWAVWVIRPRMAGVRQAIKNGNLIKEIAKGIDASLAPTWTVDKAHGIHTALPVILSVVMMLWSFILLVTFASPRFPEVHPKLLLANFLIPLFVLLIAFVADLPEGGRLSSGQDTFLRAGRCALRTWWFVGGVVCFVAYLLNMDMLDDYKMRSLLVYRYFYPPLIIMCATVSVLLIWGKQDIAQRRLVAYRWFLSALQWALFISQCWVFIWTVRGDVLGVSLWEILFGKDRGPKEMVRTMNLPEGGVYFVFFMLLIFFFGFRMRYRSNQIKDKSHYVQTIIGTGCILVTLFYLSLLSFSRWIYPYIPVAKGGGDYSECRPVRLTFNSNTTAEGEFLVPPEIQSKNSSNCLIVLDDNSSIVFLVDTNDAGGPSDWRSCSRKPPVYEIRRNVISCITYWNFDETNSNRRAELTRKKRKEPAAQKPNVARVVGP
ncbi:MAG TPA: hypothetical protein VL171_00725 [Verrucomicrobiae bacterium]|nr:hypothetical protein [Verrucomicrobiae bacterium]